MVILPLIVCRHHFNTRAGIDIDLMVPAGLLLRIDDGSGDMDIRDVRGELVIDDVRD